MNVTLKEKYLTDQEGNKIAVVLDIETYQKLLDELDELYCEKGYEQGLKETNEEIKKGDYMNFDEYIKNRL